MYIQMSTLNSSLNLADQHVGDTGFILELRRTWRSCWPDTNYRGYSALLSRASALLTLLPRPLSSSSLAHDLWCHSLNRSLSLQHPHLLLKTRFTLRLHLTCHSHSTTLPHHVEHARLQPVDWRMNIQLQQQSLHPGWHIANEKFANDSTFGNGREEPLRSSFIHQTPSTQQLFNLLMK